MHNPDFWNPEFVITPQSDGSVVMKQKGSLPEHLPTIPASLVHWAKNAPERVFLAQRDTKGSWKNTTYAEALEQIRSLAAGLLSHGLGPDKPLIIISENSTSHALIGLAAQYAGIPYAPLLRRGPCFPTATPA